MTDDMVCQELVEVVTDYLEGALPARERTRFEAHVGECPCCACYVDQMRTVSRELRGAETAALSAECREELLAEFRRAL